MPTHRKTIIPFVRKDDPCPPLKEKTYETPPHLYLGVQPPDLEQFSIEDALRKGTLWPALYGPYDSPFKAAELDKNKRRKRS